MSRSASMSSASSTAATASAWSAMGWITGSLALLADAAHNLTDVAGLLIAGTRESATLNAVLVVVKLIALAVFIAIALPAFDAGNLQPFMPYGFPKSMGADGVERGVMAAAAIIFFAFYGFDAISTAAEETKKPERDLAIGIVGSMLICTALYLVVAAAAIGARPVATFASSPEPLALILRQMGQGTAAQWIAAAAVIALLWLAGNAQLNRIIECLQVSGARLRQLVKLIAGFRRLQVEMARAFALGVEAGRAAWLARPMEPRDMAAPSTPVFGRAFT